MQLEEATGKRWSNNLNRPNRSKKISVEEISNPERNENIYKIKYM